MIVLIVLSIAEYYGLLLSIANIDYDSHCYG